jgi:hypothetical protein
VESPLKPLVERINKFKGCPMTLSRLTAALFSMALCAPVSLLAQEADPAASENTCLLNGTHFSKGATVRLTGERVRCHSNEDGFFWNRDVDGDENRNSFVFCVFDGKFFSQGAVVGDSKCNGNGNWD